MLDYRNTLCIIMGGGRGKRMFPLTSYRSKPAVPFGGRYRLIDVPISNCLNSGLNKILILTQYNSESLNKHIFRTYKLDTYHGGYVEILAADQSYGKNDWFQGTADSVRRSMPHVHDPKIEEVVILSGDQLYNLDLSVLQSAHRETNADVTIACHPEPAEQIHNFGIMSMDEDKTIKSFIEKPKDPALVEGQTVSINNKPHYLASMGIYIFKKEVLNKLLEDNPDSDDFGHQIIPAAIKTLNVKAYVFNGYWSDIGTVSSYFNANLMLVEPLPEFDLYNESWQYYTRPRYLPPAKLKHCHIEDSFVTEGCIIEEASIKRSVIGVRSRIGQRADIQESLINGNDYFESEDKRRVHSSSSRPSLGIGNDCVIKKAIIDKNVFIGNNVSIINADNVEEADGEFYSIRDGIVVIHKGAIIPDGTVI
ncbi:MAG: glucose-1-phosphate adenylyltransferase [Candidatus Omnitrophota bacterium]|jgi:glucose-1-phosphate adenylyltransferase